MEIYIFLGVALATVNVIVTLTISTPISQMNNTLYYLPQVSDVLSYASSIGECPDSYAECLGKNGWMITAIIFIILFLLTVGALATVVVFQVKKNNSMHA
jgi:hypothetical protein